MLKPTRTVLALTAGSLVLGLVSAGAAIADEDPMAEIPAHQEHAVVKKQIWGKVVSSGRLTIRSQPNTRSYSLGKIESGQRIALECKQRGERVGGNDLWYLLDNRKEQDGGNGGNNDGRGPWGDDLGDGNSGMDGDWNDGRGDGRGDGQTDGRGDGRGDGMSDGRGDGFANDGKSVKKTAKPSKVSKASKVSKKDDDDGWVAARYVKNLDTVPWCR
ncbi:hypothetical protein [Streptomyces sp. NPDC046161]|uniref:hypothetical protein n=1 Tax=Streptomyces sp. NPDC046161 TaxID=3155132 RepID=UPI0033F885D9